MGWLTVVVVGVAIPGPRASGQDPAAEAGALANRLAEAESRLTALSDRRELKLEEANKARVDLARAEHDFAAAQDLARSTAGEAQAATQLIQRRRKLLDEFLAASYRQGSILGSLTAFVGAHSPQDVLDRAEMLDIIGKTQLDRLRGLQLARIEKANKDAAARRALRDAGTKRAVADAARVAAETAEQAAVAERAAQEEQTRELRAEAARAAAQLAAARERATGTATPGGLADDVRQDGPPGAAGSGDPTVELVIQRAVSQIGVAYAWGGGDASGPTLGLHDGGAGDLYGDYRKVGFDCSGLMIYAFAGAGVDLPHYTGYQYVAGQQVPLADARRGDMLFWQDGGSIHHVALYLGDDQMVEAPSSGGRVQVTPVRYGGIAPYAVRML